MFYAFSSQLQENYFLSQPETGMGYQVIEAAKQGTYIRSKYIILNSEIAIDLDSDTGANIKKIINQGIYSVKLSSQKITFSSDIKIFSEREYRNNFNEPSATKGAIDNPKQTANGTEKLVRLSAFKDDKRIDNINNCLRPGSFTTSYNDYQNCKNASDDPIERYALPNDDKIQWVFRINPKQGDQYQRGIVQPAYGKRGGGEEFYFERGTSNNTYFPPEQPY